MVPCTKELRLREECLVDVAAVVMFLTPMPIVIQQYLRMLVKKIDAFKINTEFHVAK